MTRIAVLKAEAGIPQQIVLIPAAQKYAHGNDERRTAPKDPRI
jgi:hypothetical protein